MTFHHAIYAAHIDISNPIPWGRTPEKTDGLCIFAEPFTVECGKAVKVSFLVQALHKTGSDVMSACLFIDDQLYAVRTAPHNAPGAGYFIPLPLEYCHIPGDGLPHTYRIHIGPHAGVMSINGVGGTAGFGSTMAATLTLEEK